jgi:hemerythrin-like domain-containing protein
MAARCHTSAGQIMPNKGARMKCTDLLIQDHKAILRALDVLEHMARRMDEKEAVEWEDVDAILRFLQKFADDNHQAKEESALFPELLSTCCNQDRALRQMLFEHDQERSLTEALEDALHTRRPDQFVIFARRFVGLLRNHIDKEDHILFEIVDRSLSKEQDEKVVSEFKNFAISRDLFDGLRRLEWKYLRKAA